MSTPPDLLSAVRFTLQLEAADRQLLHHVLTDWDDLKPSLDYLDTMPALLRSAMDTSQFHSALAGRWNTTPQNVRWVCKQVNRPLAEPDEPSPAPGPVTSIPCVSRQLKERTRTLILQANHHGASYARIARYLKDHGLDVSRNKLSQLTDPDSDTAQQLGARTLERLGELLRDFDHTEHHPNPEEQAAKHSSSVIERVITNLQDQFYTSGLEVLQMREQVKKLGETDPDLQAVATFLDTLRDDTLLQLLTVDPALEATLPSLDYQQCIDMLQDLTDVLSYNQAASALTNELQRLETLGWSNELTLLKEARRLGFEQDLDLNSDDLTPEHVYPLLTYLRHIHWPPQTPAEVQLPPFTRPAPGSITGTPEREAYIEQLLKRQNGTIFTNDIAAPFGIRGSAASEYLKNYGLDVCGYGGYRQPKT